VGTEANLLNTYDNEEGNLLNTVSFKSPSKIMGLHTIGGDSYTKRVAVCTSRDSKCHILPIYVKEECKIDDKLIEFGGTKCNGTVQCWSDENKIAVYYESHLLSLWNINDKKCIWKAKNVPNDDLNLPIPIHDMSCKFDLGNPNKLYTSTAYGEIRLLCKCKGEASRKL